MGQLSILIKLRYRYTHTHRYSHCWCRRIFPLDRRGSFCMFPCKHRRPGTDEGLLYKQPSRLLQVPLYVLHNVHCSLSLSLSPCVSAEVSIGAHSSCRLLHNTDIFHSVSRSGKAHWLLLNSATTSLNDFRPLAELVGKVYISCV